MDVSKRLQLYCKIQLNSLTLGAYSVLKLTTLTTIIIMALQRAVKISAAAAADNFGWLGGARSVFRRRRRRMIPAGGGGAIRRLGGLSQSAANNRRSVFCDCYNLHVTFRPRPLTSN